MNTTSSITFLLVFLSINLHLQAQEACPPSNPQEADGLAQVIEMDGEKVAEVTDDGEVWIQGVKAGELTSEGEVWVAGNKEGSITSEGEVWKSGEKIGDVTSDGEVWLDGNEVGTVEKDGTIWKGSDRAGHFKGGKRAQAALIIFFGFFEFEN